MIPKLGDLLSFLTFGNGGAIEAFLKHIDRMDAARWDDLNTRLEHHIDRAQFHIEAGEVAKRAICLDGIVIELVRAIHTKITREMTGITSIALLWAMFELALPHSLNGQREYFCKLFNFVTLREVSNAKSSN